MFKPLHGAVLHTVSQLSWTRGKNRCAVRRKKVDRFCLGGLTTGLSDRKTESNFAQVVGRGVTGGGVVLEACLRVSERGKKNKPEYPCLENALLAATQHSNKHSVSFVIGQSLNDITSHKGAAVLLLHTIDGWRHDVLGDLWAPSESSKK